ncbi:hypothetical protein J4219_09355 [Candidatus Woesearchaeota archaeon]|nr:hypothetical protein [Candidatus Woesearchaeota archaeon]
MAKQMFVTALLLVIIVFVIGVVVGNVWRFGGSNEVSKELRSSELDAESFLVEQELFESFELNCGFAERRLTTLSADLWQLGKVLGASDAKEKLGDDDYSYLKRKYHLAQMRAYVLDKQLEVDCGKVNNVVLFYFKKDDPLSAEQGRVLDDLVSQFSMHVFAVELNYSKELNFIEEYYEIDSAPSLIVNYDSVLKGLQEKDKVVPLLHG